MILHNVVNNYCKKLPDKLKMKIVIIVLEEWPSDYKLD